MIEDWEIEELAYRAMGKSEKETEEQLENGNIDNALDEKYDCNFETYCDIVKDLIKFTPLVASPLTDTEFHAFVDVKQQRAIVKLDV